MISVAVSDSMLINICDIVLITHHFDIYINVNCNKHLFSDVMRRISGQFGSGK